MNRSVHLLFVALLGVTNGPQQHERHELTDERPTRSANMFRDTVLIGDDTLFLIGSDPTWPATIDSVAIGSGTQARGVRLNAGGYQAAHTRLRWADQGVACFSFGCGSPCWGLQVLDLSPSLRIREFMYTVFEGPALNIICYPDTGFIDTERVPFVVEQLISGEKRRIAVEVEWTAVPSASIDSAWVDIDSLRLRRSNGRVQAFDVSWADPDLH